MFQHHPKSKKQSEKANNTGIPVKMKENFENFSGFSFDDVKVHYNSSKPAQLQALAYTQGNQVYVAPGQKEHLGHELGHVVQQKQGMIRPTFTIEGMSINDDPSLESEADCIYRQSLSDRYSAPQPIRQQPRQTGAQAPVQRLIYEGGTLYIGLNWKQDAVANGIIRDNLAFVDGYNERVKNSFGVDYISSIKMETGKAQARQEKVDEKCYLYSESYEEGEEWAHSAVLPPERLKFDDTASAVSGKVWANDKATLIQKVCVLIALLREKEQTARGIEGVPAQKESFRENVEQLFVDPPTNIIPIIENYFMEPSNEAKFEALIEALHDNIQNKQADFKEYDDDLTCESFYRQKGYKRVVSCDCTFDTLPNHLHGLILEANKTYMFGVKDHFVAVRMLREVRSGTEITLKADFYQCLDYHRNATGTIDKRIKEIWIRE